jgi:hypothetical protein
MTRKLLQKSNVALIVLILLTLFRVNAQENASLINNRKHNELNEWLQSDISDWYPSNSYLDKSSGITYTYINQRYHNIIVFNGVSSIAIKDNKVVSFAPVFISHLERKVNADKPVISAAVQSALR